MTDELKQEQKKKNEINAQTIGGEMLQNCNPIVRSNTKSCKNFQKNKSRAFTHLSGSTFLGCCQKHFISVFCFERIVRIKNMTL